MRGTSHVDDVYVALLNISVIQRFGELNQITRMPNGDLHVDFQRSEVADTVCRLHARVHINGVGSVGLSWYAGKRPGQSR